MTPTPNLDALASDARATLAAAGDEDAVEAWRVATLGRSGSLTAVLRGLSGLPAEERRDAGRAANELKRDLEAALEARREELRAPSAPLRSRAAPST